MTSSRDMGRCLNSTNVNPILLSILYADEFQLRIPMTNSKAGEILTNVTAKGKG